MQPLSRTPESAEHVLAAIRECTQSLAALDLDGVRISGPQSVSMVADVETLIRQAEFLQLQAARVFARSHELGEVAHSGEFRNAAEHLGAIVRIDRGEARRRLSLAQAVLPGTSLTGESLPAALPHLGEGLRDGDIASRTATSIAMTMERVRCLAAPEMSEFVERQLVRAAVEHDPSFVRALAERWVQNLDTDGREPSEEELARFQGAFIRKPRNGLRHLELFVDAAQYEDLMTIMNSGANPRSRLGASAPGSDPGTEGSAGDAGVSGPGGQVLDGQSLRGQELDGQVRAAGLGVTSTDANVGAEQVDRRSRAQKYLDALVGACHIAMASDTLPRNGGARPVVMVTIDYRQLLAELESRRDMAGHNGLAHGGGFSSGAGARPSGLPISGTGCFDGAGPLAPGFAFSGAVSPRTVRKIACDANIIPVVLGGEGRVLDVGRASRIFPPHLRTALVARDQGCAFPGCTIPAPWCEAHHINYWSHGGGTSTDNGLLLCSHHHHVVHQEDWSIEMQQHVPWFIPPPHIDPRRRPLRNSYFVPRAARGQPG